MKYVLAVALADELEGIQGNYNTVITGVGKINATLALTEYLTNNPDTELVVNYGTAGGIDPDMKGMLHIGKFVQADMDCRAKVCMHFGVDFKCLKFISDIIGQGDQTSDWEANKALGVEMFESTLKDLIK